MEVIMRIHRLHQKVLHLTLCELLVDPEMSENLIAFLILLGIGGFVTLLVYHKNRGNPKLAIRIVACVIGTFFLVQFGMYATIRQNGRRDFKRELRKLDLKVTEIQVNGNVVDLATEEVIKELLSVDNLRAHHSSPTDELIFHITDGQTEIKFKLGRDSEFKTEYWLDIKGRNIGKIRTRLFNDIE
ncbi:hypothetical protein [Poritiphilus flavus]|uniref:Uncharacterized protein n=1 Tax=Poritiphilus flavus TaxID=2697053 RepID=A0A6L9EBV6_9FLAO|nr:hypothetical protein [Poritiphilus flavus]NAS12226.1 hypothetical protein [Poritiphilus flavus]